MQLRSRSIYGNYGLISLTLIILLNYLGWVFSVQSKEFEQLLVMAYLLVLTFVFYQFKDLWPTLIYIVLAGILILWSGTNGHDARSLWLFHAKRIYFDNNLYTQLDNYAPWSHNTYPTLYPAFAATLAGAIGHWNEVFPKSTSLFFLSPPLLLVSSFLREKAVICLYIICMMIVSKDLFYNGYIDPLIALYTSAIVFLLRSEILTNKNSKINSLFILNLCFIIVLPLLKNEGMVILGCLFFSLIITKPKIIKIYLLPFFISVLIYFFTWKLPVLNSNMNEISFIDGFLGRLIDRMYSGDLILIARKILNQIWYWLVLIVGIIYLNRSSRDDVRFIGSFLSIYISLIILIYLSTPYDLVWHLETSLDRVLMPIIFVIFSYIALIISKYIKFQSH